MNINSGINDQHLKINGLFLTGFDTEICHFKGRIFLIQIGLVVVEKEEK